MDIKGLIIARGESERVPRKNVKPFTDGNNLIQLKIRQLKQLSQLSEVVVNSDDDEILEIAKREEVTTVKRHPYYGKSDTPIKEVYKEVANINCDYILFANCTSPLIKNHTLEKMLIRASALNNSRVQSMNTINPVHKFLWHDVHGAMYDAKNQPRSQDINNVYEINWAAAIVKQKYMMLEGRVVAEYWFPVNISEEESVDINNEIDWELAKILWQKQSS